MKPSANGGYKTVGQAAKVLDVSRQAVHQMIGDGRLHAIWMLEQWAIHEAELQRVKEQREKSEQVA
jgi:excisionase family DNA binding protein